MNKTAQTSLSLEESRIDNLFLSFLSAYGHTWLSIYKSKDSLAHGKKTWLKELLEFDNESLEYAIDKCIKHYRLPPTLPQFVECCKSYSRHTDFFKKEEEVLKQDKRIADFHLQKIKAILKEAN